MLPLPRHEKGGECKRSSLKRARPERESERFDWLMGFLSYCKNPATAKLPGLFGEAAKPFFLEQATRNLFLSLMTDDKTQGELDEYFKN